FVLLLAAAIERFDIADEENLEGRHQRGRLCEVERFEDGCLGEVEIVQGEVAQVGWDQCVENSAAGALEKEGVVAEEDVTGARSLAGGFGEETVDGREAAE